MDNNELVLKMLTQLIDGQNELNSKVNVLVTGQEQLSNQITDIKMHLENVTDNNIQLIAEQFAPYTLKVDNSVSEIEKLKFDTDNIKITVISHSKIINSLHK